MTKFKKISVVPKLPERIFRLKDLAFSFWSVWNPEIRNLFEDLNPKLWALVERNPVKFLKNVSQRRLENALDNQLFLEKFDKAVNDYDEYMKSSETWFLENSQNKDMLIAYFSAEFGIAEYLPMYSGGLGILAGDHLKSSSDLGCPLIGIGLLYKNGYFDQKINKEGWQESIYREYNFSDFPITPMKNDYGEEIKISIDLPDGKLFARVWKGTIMRTNLLLLDADIPENPEEYRQISAKLYGGDIEMRIKQEILLGIGGVRAARMAGYNPTVWHMNEGHSAFLVLERIREFMEGKGLSFKEAFEAARSNSVFTTHTPVPAGNDAFHYSMMEKYFSKVWNRLKLTKEEFLKLGTPFGEENFQMFNLTIFALKSCSWKNGVSRLHGKVSRELWKNVWFSVPTEEIPIQYITNGIHTPSWINDDMRVLFDKFLPDWEKNLINPEYWVKIDEIPDEILWKTIKKMKKDMIDFIHLKTNEHRAGLGETVEQLREIDKIFDTETITLGFARRFATYKRATLIFRNFDRLKAIVNNPEMPVQFVFAGKAHPADRPGQELLKKIYEISRYPEFKNKIVLLENYNIEVARHLVSGVDIWINTPRRPHEASGTSGQKVPVNGGLNFSVLDGWWEEGYNGKNGWIIGDGREYSDNNIQDTVDSVSFYDTLEKEVIARYYKRDERDIPVEFLKMIRESMKSVTPVFSTHRMVKDYINNLYSPADNLAAELYSSEYKELKIFSAWKEKMTDNWEPLRISLNSDRVESEEIEAGSQMEFSTTVYLGDIKPEDVEVEMFFERFNIFGELEGYEVFGMEMEKETLHNTYIYRGKIKLEERGSYSYSVRIIPKNTLLPSKHDLGLIRWIHN